MSDLKTVVKAQARACGFDLVGVASADEFVADREAALERIRDGQMDGLPWYTESRVMRGTSPEELLPGARSIVCLGVSYLGNDWPGSAHPELVEGRAEPGGGRPEVDSRFRGNDEGSGNGGSSEDDGRGGNDGSSEDDGGSRNDGGGGNDGGSRNDGGGGNDGDKASTGRVARYAWVRDYHRAMKRRMRDLVRSLERELSSEVAARWYVDDGPMLDRAAANRAGIGWFGKNSNILNPLFGSWVFLAQVITDLDLEPDAPLKKSCGSCSRCIDDCPTGAIVAPYVVDNSRCISYLTIENRGEIPREMRPLVQDWVFGCDICQDVCPVNRKAQPGRLTAENGERPHPDLHSKGEGISSVLSGSSAVDSGFLDLIELLEMSEDEFRQRFAGTSIMRAKRVGMQRNACVALGNAADETAVPALAKALASAEPLVRGHAAWALGRIGGGEAIGVLANAAKTETDRAVLDEISAALAESAGG